MSNIVDSVYEVIFLDCLLLPVKCHRVVRMAYIFPSQELIFMLITHVDGHVKNHNCKFCGMVKFYICILFNFKLDISVQNDVWSVKPTGI